MQSKHSLLNLKVLVIKTSSMGDIIHAFPALYQAKKHLVNISFDWVVEENFVELVKMHPLVDKIFILKCQKWRKSLKLFWSDKQKLKKELRQYKYDLVIDAQGLLKSSYICRWVQGKSFGYDFKSIKEKLACFFYDRKITVSRNFHAITRVNMLFSLSLNYTLASDEFYYDKLALKISKKKLSFLSDNKPFIVLVANSSWTSKNLPLDFSLNLILKIVKQGFKILLTWGNEKEKQKSLFLLEGVPIIKNQVLVLPKLDLNSLAIVFKKSQAVISVDTGLAHLSAMLDVPTITIFGPTKICLTGIKGNFVINLKKNIVCSGCMYKTCPLNKNSPPCYKISTDKILSKLNILMQKKQLL